MTPIREVISLRALSCGYTENADINAARNILAAGHVVLACGEDVKLLMIVLLFLKKRFFLKLEML